MKLTVRRLLGEAWRLARRDHDLLLRIAAPFLFLPVLARTLLVAPFPFPGGGKTPPDLAALQADPQAMQAWAAAINRWLAANGPIEAGAMVLTLYGALALIGFYCDPAAASLGAALRRSVTLWPRYLLVTILVALPLAPFGVMALAAPPTLALTIVPMLYLEARTSLAAPILLAEPRTSALQALIASWRRTRGQGLALTAAIAVVTLAAQLLVSIPLAATAAVKQGGGSAVALVILNAGAAAIAMLGGIGLALIAVTAYRALPTAAR